MFNILKDFDRSILKCKFLFVYAYVYIGMRERVRMRDRPIYRSIYRSKLGSAIRHYERKWDQEDWVAPIFQIMEVCLS